MSRAGLSGAEAQLDACGVELATGGQLVLLGLPLGGVGGVLDTRDLGSAAKSGVTGVS